MLHSPAICFRSHFPRSVQLCVISIIAVLAIPHPVAGWGAQGHRIIGQIAWHFLTPEAKAGVQELLGDMSLGAAGTWADEIRSDHAYDWAKPLHYVNVPREAEAVDTARDCANGECVIGAIRRFKAVVQNPEAPREERVEALKFLIHFVGDVHQPLHVSYADDRGGNSITLTFMGRKTNLHALWDTGLIEQALHGEDWMRWGEGLGAAITDETAQRLMASKDPLAWCNESLLITRRLYDELPGDELGADYHERNVGTVKDQLTAAGVRLAAVLNDIFHSAATKEP